MVHPNGLRGPWERGASSRVPMVVPEVLTEAVV